MPQPMQSYKNHARVYPLFHYFVGPVLIVNFFNAIRHVWNRPMRDTAWEAVLAFALMVFAWTARAMVIAVQDRVIRLEMRLRLAQVLPADLRPRINDLSINQLCALRFAPDAELPELTRKVLADNIRDRKSIKRMVKNWEADVLRA